MFGTHPSKHYKIRKIEASNDVKADLSGGF